MRRDERSPNEALAGFSDEERFGQLERLTRGGK